jgi:WD40 repeat protein
MSDVTVAEPINPFPGLRPFTEEESHLFFGREGQSDELLRKLTRRRFLAVVGTSGTGKSSLVRAGFLPSLRDGYLLPAGPSWRVIDLKPGRDPIGNLAAALKKSQLAEQTLDANILRMSSLALVRTLALASEDGRRKPRENVLILVDQFEELFTYPVPQDQAMADHDEKAAFVALLIEAAHHDALPVYVVITMRSDFLGDCAKFRDLPEAINEGQYLIPRMTRDERRAAIEGPVRLAGGQIEPTLVQRILNDCGENPEQLPILQHALMRMWTAGGSGTRLIDLEDYKGIGTLDRALSLHADEAYEEARDRLPGGPGQQIVRRVFTRLRLRDANGRETRRPTPAGELRELANASMDELTTVLNCFREKRRTFLRIDREELLPNTDVDVSHECLFTRWQALVEWIDQEEKFRTEYMQLLDRTAQHQRSGGDYLSLNALGVTRETWQTIQPTSAWTRRYDSTRPGSLTFEDVERFLDNSRKFHDAQAREIEQREAERAQARAEGERAHAREIAAQQGVRRRRKNRMFGVAVFLFLFVAGTAFAILMYTLANRNRDLADRSRELLDAQTQREQTAGALAKAKQDALTELVKDQSLETQRAEDRARQKEVEARTQKALRERTATLDKIQLEQSREQTLASARMATASQTIASAAQALANEKTRAAISAENLRRDADTRRDEAVAEVKELNRRTVVRSLALQAQRKAEERPDEWQAAALVARQALVFNVDDPEEEIYRALNTALDKGDQLSFSAGSPGVHAVKIQRDQLVVGSDDGAVRVFDLRTWPPPMTVLADRTPTGTFSAIRTIAMADATVAVGTMDGRIRMWDIKATPPRSLPGWQAHSGSVNSLVFNAGGDLISGGTDGQVTMWSLKSLKPDGTPDGRSLLKPSKVSTRITALATTGENVLVAGQGRKILRWNNLAQSTEPVSLFEAAGEVRALTFTADGTLIAGLRGGSVAVFDPQHRNSPEILKAHNTDITGLATGPQNMFASSGVDGSVKLWKLSGSTVPADVTPKWSRSGDIAWTWAVEFDGDRNRLLSADEKGRLRAWILDAKTLADLACARVTNDLSDDDPRWKSFAPGTLEYRRCEVSARLGGQ